MEDGVVSKWRAKATSLLVYVCLKRPPLLDSDALGVVANLLQIKPDTVMRYIRPFRTRTTFAMILFNPDDETDKEDMWALNRLIPELKGLGIRTRAKVVLNWYGYEIGQIAKLLKIKEDSVRRSLGRQENK